MDEIQALARSYGLAQLLENLAGHSRTSGFQNSSFADQTRRSYPWCNDFMQSSAYTNWGQMGLPNTTRPAHAATKATPGITFEDLVTSRKSQLVAGTGGKLGSFNNERTTLKKFLAFVGATPDMAAGPHFDGQFDAKLERFLRTVASASQASYRTRMGTWLRIYRESLAKLDGNRPLHGILQERFGEPDGENYPERIRKAAQASGMTVEQLKGWITGRSAPGSRPSTRKKLEALERSLGFEPGHLSSKGGRFPHSEKRSRRPQEEPESLDGEDDTGSPEELGNTDHKPKKKARKFSQREINRVLIAVNMRPNPFPSEVEEFIKRLIEFKTGAALVLDASGQPIIDHAGENRGWGQDAAHNARQQYSMMVSWLCLPLDRAGAEAKIKTAKLREGPRPDLLQQLIPMFQGKGMSPGDVHVCHLLDPVLVKEYIEWRKKRALGKTNNTLPTQLGRLKSLVAAKYGFVTQQPELAWSMPALKIPRLDPTDADFEDNYEKQKVVWAAKCAKWHDLLAMFTKSANKNFKNEARTGSTRSFDAILNLDDPLSVLITLIQRHGSRRPVGMPARRPTTVTEAQWLQDEILLRFILSNPLRNRNFREMTWRPNNTGNLYRKGDEWRLRFTPGEMKNGGGRKTAYDVSVTPDLYPYLELWLLSDAKSPAGREIMLPATRHDVDNVFVNRRGTYSRGALSKRFAALTEGYCDDIPGGGAFRSHAWRHIVSTGYLKATGDFLTLSFILHDDIDTVMEHYAHLVPNDGFEVYGRWLRGRTTGLL